MCRLLVALLLSLLSGNAWALPQGAAFPQDPGAGRLGPPLGRGYPTPAQPGYDWIVVLGAAQYGGRPSPALERRLEAALRLYQKGLAPRVAVAGGRLPGDRYSEGEVGCRYLRAKGVPQEALLCETQSQTTYENLLFLKPHLFGRVLLVTDAPHLARALFLARLLGLRAEGHGVPGAYPLAYWLREALYRLWLYLGLRPFPGGHGLKLPPNASGNPGTPAEGL